MSLKPMDYNPNKIELPRVRIRENTKDPINSNWNIDDLFLACDDINNDNDWRTDEEKAIQSGYYKAYIYNMNYKEFQCYMYNQIEELKSVIQCIYDVVKEGEK